MILEKINVRTDILKSNSNYANSTKYDKGYTYFKNRIDGGLDNKILLIDFRDVILSHYFARCLGEIFKISRDCDSKFDIVFQLEEFQISDLLLGLIDNLKLSYSQDKDGSIEDFAKENGINLKLMLEENILTFFSKNDDKTTKVLEIINKKIESDFDQLLDNGLAIPNVELYPILTELTDKRFVYQIGKDVKYYSAYKFLKES